MATNVIIEASREGYSPEQVRNTMTVRNSSKFFLNTMKMQRCICPMTTDIHTEASVMATFQNRKLKNNSRTQPRYDTERIYRPHRVHSTG